MKNEKKNKKRKKEKEEKVVDNSYQYFQESL